MVTSDWLLQTYTRVAGLETRNELDKCRLDHTDLAIEA